MDIKKEKIESVINMPNLARWAPGVDALGWTVRVADGLVRFNNKLDRGYTSRLVSEAKTALKTAGHVVSQLSASALVVSDRERITVASKIKPHAVTAESDCATVDLGEFTAPFDLERAKAGEIMIDGIDGTVRILDRIDGEALYFLLYFKQPRIHDMNHCCSIDVAAARYLMRPAVKGIADMLEPLRVAAGERRSLRLRIDMRSFAEQDAKEAQRVAKEQAIVGVDLAGPNSDIYNILHAHASRNWKVLTPVTKAEAKKHQPTTDWKSIETVVILETEKQRLTREASTRYFAKLDQQSVRTGPVGEHKMLEIFGQALDDFEAEINRRKES